MHYVEWQRDFDFIERVTEINYENIVEMPNNCIPTAIIPFFITLRN